MLQSNAARLAWARDPYGRETKLGELVSQFQFNYDVAWRVWIFADWQKEKVCPLLRDYKVEYASCDTILPFICEKGWFSALVLLHVGLTSFVPDGYVHARRVMGVVVSSMINVSFGCFSGIN